MANAQKYTRAQVKGLTRHYDRSTDNGELVKFRKNQDIDPARSHLNYNLAPERDEGQLAFISRRTSEVKCLKRDDVNVMCSWVVTAPKGLDENEHERFFRETYLFLNRRYADGSDKNVISAFVHMDEATPHLHYAFVPVVHDKKKGVDKVSAKLAINRGDLQTFHGDLERHMTAVFGREVGILNEATKDGNKEIDELKRGTAMKIMQDERACHEQEINRLREEKSTAKNELDSIKSEINFTALELQKGVAQLESKKKAVEGEIKALEKKKTDVKGKILELENIKAITPVSNLPFVKDRAVYFVSDVENLKKTATQRAEVDEETRETQRENVRLKKKIGELTSENKALQAKIPPKESFKDVMAAAEEKKRFYDMQRKAAAFDRLPRDVRDELLASKGRTSTSKDER